MLCKQYGIAIVFFFVCVGVAEAQNVGSLSGRVTDPTGAIVPGARVDVQNLDTGLSRTVSTDEQGNYRAPQLPLGNYQVEASFEGFRSILRTGIVLTVGRDATVDFQLAVGEVQEVVTVVGDAPLIETTKADMGALVSREQIADLPLRSRDFSQLIILQAGTVQFRHGSPSSTAGYGARISVNGARSSSNSFTMDGVDINNPNQLIPSGVDGAMLGVEAIREFKVLGSNYSAQYGRAAGANLMAVTRSGTNSLDGSLFWYLRNDNLDAARWEANAFGQPKPEFRRNQFGFSLGGPLVRDKAFFFTTYEGVRQTLPRTNVVQVPSTSARLGILPTGNVQVNEAVKPYLSLWPTPNRPEAPNSLVADWVNPDSLDTKANYFSVRVDHQFHSNHSLFGRYTIDDSNVFDAYQIPLFGDDTRIRNQFGSLEQRSILSPTMINAIRLAYSRSAQFVDVLPVDEPDRSLSFVEGRPFGGIAPGSGITGLQGFSGSAPRNFILNIYQLYDDVTLERARHSLKFGMTLERFIFNRVSFSRLGGSFTFGNFASFIQNQPATRLRIEGPFQFVDSRGRQRTFDPYRTLFQNLFAAYVQDDFRVRPNLTLNLGARWEFTTVPEEKWGRLANLRHVTDDFPTVGGQLYDNPTLDNISPRVGIAWDPTGAGKTSVRAGAGFFYEPILTRLHLNGTDTNPPFRADLDVTGSALTGVFPNLNPHLIRLAVEGALGLHNTAFDLQSPYVAQFSLAVQQSLSTNTLIEMGYTGSRGIHLDSRQDYAVPVPIRQSDGRLFFPEPTNVNYPILNPNFSRLEWYSTGAFSNYHGLRLTFTRKLSQGLHFQSAYTWSKATDNLSAIVSGELGGSAVQNAFDMKANKGLADFHVAHNFVTNFAYELPFGPNRRISLTNNAIGAALIGGWQLAGVFTVQTGSPLSAASNSQLTHRRIGGGTRPDLAPGRDNNPVYHDKSSVIPNQAGFVYFDSNSFAPQQPGFYGNLGRNTIIGPGLLTADFSLMKNTRWGEGHNVQFRAEFFNLFNRANFAQPSATIFDSAGRFVQNAGRITATSGTPRQIQLALRLTF